MDTLYVLTEAGKALAEYEHSSSILELRYLLTFFKEHSHDGQYVKRLLEITILEKEKHLEDIKQKIDKEELVNVIIEIQKENIIFLKKVWNNVEALIGQALQCGLVEKCYTTRNYFFY